jgi:glycosyltransferase involved in cell wall biosynthesis
MIKVSVVVPIYNVEKYIGTLIESLQEQTLKDIELILVDDGSPDRSGDICDEYASKDSRIIVIHKKNGGVSAARNDGMERAQGEYIIFCDSDDWLPLDALEKLYNEGKRVDADIIIGDVYQSKNGDNKLARFYAEPFVTEDKEFISKMIQADFYRTYCPMPPVEGPAFGYGGPWNKAVRLNILRENNIKFDVRVKGIFDDILYTAYILACAKRISYITEPVYYYRIIPMSITRTYKPNALEINDAIFNSWREFRIQYDSGTLYEKPYYAVVVRRFAEILPVYFFSKKNTKSFPQKMREISNVLCQEPYMSALDYVDISKLTKYHRLILKTMKMRSPFLIWCVFKLLQLFVLIRSN